MSYNQKITIMEARVIIASAQKSNRSNNMVWAVAVTGEESPRAFCKSAYKAMRFMFLLKKQTGLNISDNCLSRLSKEVQEMKVVMAKAEALDRMNTAEIEKELAPVIAEQEEQEKAKAKQRKPRRSKKEAKVVALS